MDTEWLKRNSSSINFGAPLIVQRETEHFAIVKRPGHWARLSAHGQSYIAVTYLLVAKTYHHGDITSWYRHMHYGRLSDADWTRLVEQLDTAEATNTLPPHSAEPRQRITNHR